MILYNVTIKIDWHIHDAWLQWMQEEHIPAVMATGCFQQYTFVHLMDVDDDEGPTYACQYFALNQELYEKYIAVHSNSLREAGLHKWGNQFIAFRTLMKVVATSAIISQQ
jgi:Domain of unknown function (DUF4286)